MSIKIHYLNERGELSEVPIESYNPFFGCDVGFLNWMSAEHALLIYTEKHWTFAYRIGDQWPPAYKKIESRWGIQGDTLLFLKYKGDEVHRLRIPSLEELPSISVLEAEKEGTLPPDPFAS